jgi:predicted dehydrogenase
MRVLKKTIGIIGPGEHFKKKIYPVLKKSNFFKVSGILRIKKKKFKRVINLDENNFFKKNFDFIYISCPNQFHEKYIIKSLSSGSNVICEKPFLLNKKKLNKIINLSKKKKKLIFEAFMYLYHPAFKYVKNIIKNNKFGKLRYLVSNFRFPSLNKQNNRYFKKQGNGFFYDCAPYLLSLENELFGNFYNKNKFYYTQKIKKKVDLKGNIFISSSKINRFYFWGEGQNYSNNIELFFDSASVFIDKFFSKKNNEDISIRIFKDYKIKEISIKKVNHFSRMFSNIKKNYKNILFQEYHRKKIMSQSNNLLKYKN